MKPVYETADGMQIYAMPFGIRLAREYFHMPNDCCSWEPCERMMNTAVFPVLVIFTNPRSTQGGGAAFCSRAHAQLWIKEINKRTREKLKEMGLNHLPENEHRIYKEGDFVPFPRRGVQ